MTVLIVVLVIVIALVVFVVVGFNKLRTTDIGAQEALGGIDVQLTRRSDLIPNLVETVKGYAGHEREVLENVTRARAELVQSGSPEQAARADNALTGALRSLFAVAEAYPELQADENFLDLQGQLQDTENKIAVSRQVYNDTVLTYHNAIQTFPAVLVAGMFGFRPREFFEIEDPGDREVPAVSFSTPSA